MAQKTHDICHEDTAQIVKARVLPDTAVQSEAGKNDDTERSVIRSIADICINKLRGNRMKFICYIEPCQQRQKEGCIYRKNVIYNQEEAKPKPSGICPLTLPICSGHD